MEADLTKYIGRGYDTFNCFDLVKEFYFDQFGLTIKNYYEGDVPNRAEVQSLIISNKGSFVRTEEPRFGDIIVIKLYGLECHLGIYIGHNKFLHSARNIGSLIDRTERYSKMIAGYYRHRECHDQA